jgi:hypothetical protein
MKTREFTTKVSKAPSVSPDESQTMIIRKKPNYDNQKDGPPSVGVSEITVLKGNGDYKVYLNNKLSYDA